MHRIKEQLMEANVGKVLQNEPMKNYTTWKIGGPADLMVIPRDLTGLIKGLEIVAKHQIPWIVIGRGSNMLVLDGGIRGVTFKLMGGFDDLKVEGTQIRVGGGYPVIKLAIQIAKLGLEGMEFAGGIPGSIGGAVYMNAGAHGSDISKILKEATILWDDGQLETLTNEQLKFSYRTSLLQKRRGIVIEVLLELKEGERKNISHLMALNKKSRLSTQPLLESVAGSVFRNPPGDHAGRLIEAAGLKGYQIGGAKVSELHANFIVNENNASARDVLALIEHIQKVIEERFQICLQTEVLVIGEG